MSDNPARRAGHSPIHVKPGESLADTLAARRSSTLIPLSDANDLDAVVHALAIEDSTVTPAEAVEELKVEIERLRADLHKALSGSDDGRMKKATAAPITSQALDAIADLVLIYRPKPKSSAAKKRKRKAAKIAREREA